MLLVGHDEDVVELHDVVVAGDAGETTRFGGDGFLAVAFVKGRL